MRIVVAALIGAMAGAISPFAVSWCFGHGLISSDAAAIVLCPGCLLGLDESEAAREAHIEFWAMAVDGAWYALVAACFWGMFEFAHKVAKHEG